MRDWKDHVETTKTLLRQKRLREAQLQIEHGLKEFPNQFDLLINATQVYRALCNHSRSLIYSELLLKHHPTKINGYIRSLTDLIALKRFNHAESIIQQALEKFPSNYNLLAISTEALNASGNRLKSLYYSELLIRHYPQRPLGYIRALESLIATKRFSEARKRSIEYMSLFPKNSDLYCISQRLLKDLRSINLLPTEIQENQLCPSTSSTHDTQRNLFQPLSIETHCFLIRCTCSDDDSARTIYNTLSKIVPSSSIWICADKAETDLDSHVISISEFRRGMGLEWSIIAKPGYIFGDFCYYAALAAGLNYQYYTLIEDDVFFAGQSLSLFLDSILLSTDDLIAANFGNRSPSQYHWLSIYSYSHPNDKSELGCLYPITRLSRRAAYYLYNERVQEFNKFLETEFFIEEAAKKYFSNDEAFTCNSLANKEHFRLSCLNTSLTSGSFGLFCVMKPDNNLHKNQIIHRYSPNSVRFKSKVAIYFRNQSRAGFEFTALVLECILLNIRNQIALNNIRIVLQEATYADREDVALLNNVLDSVEAFAEAIARSSDFFTLQKNVAISFVKGLRITANSVSRAKVRDFEIGKWHSRSYQFLKRISLPFSVEGEYLYSVIAEPAVTEKGFFYMEQRRLAKVVLREPIQNKEVSYTNNQEDFIFVFSQGRCGSTLLSNLLRNLDVVSISECDALTSSGKDKNIISKVISGFNMNVHLAKKRIAFKFRAGSCANIVPYLELYPKSFFIFVQRSPEGWARSYSAKFKWKSEQMLFIYKHAHACYRTLRRSSHKTLFLDYDRLDCWIDQMLSDRFLVGSDSADQRREAMEETMKTDSQAGFITNDVNDYDAKQVSRFMSHELPIFD